jgi:hypothetical protein
MSPDKFLSRSYRCEKCRSAGRLRFFVRPDEPADEATRRAQREMRERCVGACAFALAAAPIARARGPQRRPK